jgi:SET domain-containing protein
MAAALEALRLFYSILHETDTLQSKSDMKLNLAPGLAIKASAIEGRGCFSTANFERWRKIAEYTGERISTKEAKRRAGRRRLRICEIDERWSLDGSRGGNGTHYINHSCTPNAFMKILYGHILFISLRDIKPGEEITIDYESTLHSDTKRCSCGSRSCRGTINKID